MAKNVDPKPFDIPLEGSLGLLALGAVGVLAWKKKRKETGYVIPHNNFIKKKPEELKAGTNKKADKTKKKNEPDKKEDKKT